MQNKIDQLTGIERRVNNLIENIDIQSINRQLALKADRSEIDKKINTNENDLIDLKTDLDYLISFYKKLIDFLDNPDAHIVKNNEKNV